MKKQFAIFLMSLVFVKAQIFGFTVELNTSYDYFRGIPDGSWNGNTGALIAANGNIDVLDCMNVQLGGSYGWYNWDGRGNVVFANPKRVEQIGFVTAGGSVCFCEWKGGIVYDRMFTQHFGIYNADPSIDQLRFKAGYTFCCSDELGVWGTLDLTRAHQRRLGVPLEFKAIGQMNLFWSHFFENCAETTVWIGMPYRDSLRYHHKIPGVFIAGFAFRAPLTEQFLLEGNGSYMAARRSHGVNQSRNYGASISVGLTYLFGGCNDICETSYMTIANHSNFFVDTNVNQ